MVSEISRSYGTQCSPLLSMPLLPLLLLLLLRPASSMTSQMMGSTSPLRRLEELEEAAAVATSASAMAVFVGVLPSFSSLLAASLLSSLASSSSTMTCTSTDARSRAARAVALSSDWPVAIGAREFAASLRRSCCSNSAWDDHPRARHADESPGPTRAAWSFVERYQG